MIVADSSLEAEVLISEANFEEWKFKSGDFVACSVRSNGVDNEGKLTVFFNSFLEPFEIAELLYEINDESARNRGARRGPNEAQRDGLPDLCTRGKVLAWPHKALDR